jgi:hypothetical protein
MQFAFSGVGDIMRAIRPNVRGYSPAYVTSPWFPILIYHMGDEQQARW